MAKIDLYNQEGKVVGDYELSDAIFAIEPNEDVVLQVLKAQLANRRQGTAKTKTRTEVRGGGKKPWRQKGTGRARHGSTRSPIWVGGGVSFGPVPRSYKQKVNKKQRRLAIKSVLSNKLTNNKVVVLDELKFDQPKTKEFAKVLENLKIQDSVLVVVDKNDENTVLSARNLKDVRLTTYNAINVFDLLKYDTFVMTKAGADKIEEVYA